MNKKKEGFLIKCLRSKEQKTAPPHLSALMLKAVRNNLVGETGKFRQNLGNAFSMSALSMAAPAPDIVQSADEPVVELPLPAADLVSIVDPPPFVVLDLSDVNELTACLLNRMRIARAMR